MSRPGEDVPAEEQSAPAAEVPAPETPGSEAPAPEARVEEAPAEMPAVAEELLFTEQPESAAEEDLGLRAVVEAIVYITEEPVTVPQIAAALERPEAAITRVLDELTAEYARSLHGVMLREVAGGYKMTTKPEHHETMRAFVKSLKPPLKLSLAALETLATIAYKQPITAPEVQEIRGVQGTGVLKTLLDRKLIQASGRKNVLGRPILYKTTREFLVQFGLNDLTELPTLKEFEELRRLDTSEPEAEADAPAQPEAQAQPQAEPEPLPQSEVEPQPEAETQPQSEAEPQPQPEAEPQPEPEAEAQPQPAEPPAPEEESNG